ncbi:RNA polymerase II subunit B1 CTD phosphatase RPAP2 isoform X2 [Olea europaea subsp. europaea]|uniref:RNA polymerase II subunit B1 CTD phosphatase RPAP2 homolog n=1 Tax=Olea europaea subsp. europaea TaxID=158383 RepID=A0A8S0TM66_OLEEU|nr:RNA polymerase II subunit B1 CTD phosphatase RPAP2 isoform X2 [Olea europaea subsp. europaea]
MPDYSAKMGEQGGQKPENKGPRNVGPAMKKPIDPKRVLQILECKRKVLAFVESMLEPEVTMEELKAGEELICRQDYDSIAQERHILKICGYPLCPNKLTKVWNQRFHVSLKDKKIYDVEIRKLYCSVRCMETSIKYRNEQVPDQPMWMRLDDIKMGPDGIEAPTE